MRHSAALWEEGRTCLHRWAPRHLLREDFVDVGKLESDRFSLLGDILFVYEVNEIKIIRPWEFDAFSNHPEKSLLTLFTCDPIPTFENRLLITGELISIEKINPDSDLDELTLIK